MSWVSLRTEENRLLCVTCPPLECQPLKGSILGPAGEDNVNPNVNHHWDSALSDADTFCYFSITDCA